MEQYAGLDVSLEATSVCVVDGTGRVVREAKVPSEPEALVAWFAGQNAAMVRIGLKAGPLSQWLFAGMADAGGLPHWVVRVSLSAWSIWVPLLAR